MRVSQLKKYAKLLAKMGLNVKKGQTVFIQAGLDQPEFVTMVVEECYKAGAKAVYVEWSHQPVGKLNAKYKSLETLSALTPWDKAKWEYKASDLSCRLFIESEDPDGMNGIDQEKMSQARRAQYPQLKPFRDAIENRHQWCIAAVPGKAGEKGIPRIVGKESGGGDVEGHSLHGARGREKSRQGLEGAQCRPRKPLCLSQRFGA